MRGQAVNGRAIKVNGRAVKGEPGGGCCCDPGCPCPYSATRYDILDVFGGDPNYVGMCRYSGAQTAPFNHGKRWEVRVKLDGVKDFLTEQFGFFTSNKMEYALEFFVRYIRASYSDITDAGFPISGSGILAYGAQELGVPESHVTFESIFIRDTISDREAGFFLRGLKPGLVGTVTSTVDIGSGPTSCQYEYDTDSPDGPFRETYGDLLTDVGPTVHNELFDLRYPVVQDGECQQPILNGGRFLREMLTRTMGLPRGSGGTCIANTNLVGGDVWCDPGAFTQDERDSIYACGGDHVCHVVGGVDGMSVFRSETSARVTAGPLVGVMRLFLEDDAIDTRPGFETRTMGRYEATCQYAIDITEPCPTADPVISEYVDPPADRDPECNCIDPESETLALRAVPCNPDLDPAAYDPLLWENRPDGANLLIRLIPDPDGGLEPISACYTPTFIQTQDEPDPSFTWTSAACDEEPCVPPGDYRIAVRCGPSTAEIVVNLNDDPGGSGTLMALRAPRQCYTVTDQVAQGPATPIMRLFRTNSTVPCLHPTCVGGDPEPPDPTQEPRDPFNPASSAPPPPGPIPDDVRKTLDLQARGGGCRGCGDGFTG